MDKIHALKERDSGIASGVKAAALVVILGIFAAVADHTLLASHAPDAGLATRIASYAEVSSPAPALPAGIRAHEGEVPAHVEAF
jgi:hypothetical protein